MFLHLLDDDQLDVFMQAARFLTGVDGVIEAREVRLLEAIATETGVEQMPEAYQDLDQTLGALERLSSDPVRTATFLELAGVVFADDEATDGELECLKAIGAKLGTSEDMQMAAADLARRAVELRQDAEQLVATGRA